MWYTIILLSIANAVSIGFWFKADRMAAHYRREAQEEKSDNSLYRDDIYRRCQNRIDKEKDARRAAVDIASSLNRELTTTRRQLAAARGQITKLRRKYGEIE